MSDFSSQDVLFMERALELANNGINFVSPNPAVGAVIVKDGKIISEGFHEKYGSAHAEVNALKKISGNLEDATLYVTLEPCSHTGNTPPCALSVIESGIKKVVIAAKDPSKKVNGKGIELLKNAGIEVKVGLLEKIARKLNEKFYFFHENGRPYITVKVAVSKDMKIGKDRSKQTKITGKEADIFTHNLRARNHAILVGAGTVISDNPHLGVRLANGRDPLRIILKGEREIDKNAKVFRDENFLVIENKNIEECIKQLSDMGINSILVEGGQKIISEFIKAKMVDQFIFLQSKTSLGKNAIPLFKENSLLPFRHQRVQQLGDDTLISAAPSWDSNQQ